jgi:hypothetical protein
MKYRITGYLYGHYDSRGGATFIEAKSREEADPFYSEAFMCEGYDEVTPEQQAKEICDDDYLGPATIESDVEIAHGQDLEHDENALPLWVHTDESQDPVIAVYKLRYGGECPEGFQESELGEDAFGVVVLRAGKSTFEG